MALTDTHEETTSVPVRLDFDGRAAGFARALAQLDKAATKELDRVGFDARLRELVRPGLAAERLRLLHRHAHQGRPGGGRERAAPYGLSAWPDTPYFSARERAALAFTEAVTLLAGAHVPDAAYEAVAAHYDPDEVAALLSLIVTINAWNAVGVATHAWTPGSYQR